MKRVVLPLVLVVLFAGAGFYLLRHVRPHGHEAAEWLPGNTLLFESMPNIHRTTERWPATALAQIVHEPEVQAFLARPMGELPFKVELDKRLGQLKAIDPASFFIAATEWGGSGVPKTIAGLDFSGTREDMDAVVSELRTQAQQSWPEGKSDIQKYGSGDIETFTTPSFSAALAYRDHWLFIATDTDLLKATLDRYEAIKAAPDSLAELPAFKNCLQHLPDAPDNILFFRPSLLADKAASLMLMLNPTADVQQMDKLKQTDAIGLAWKMDGLLMRDASFTIQPPPPGSDAPLAKDALKLSSQDTILAVSSVTGPYEQIQLPDPKSDPSGIFKQLQEYLKAFTSQGLGAKQWDQAFGPECGLVVDWPNGFINYPTPLIMLDVRDVAEAHKFLDTLPSLALSNGMSFARQEDGGITFYSLPSMGMGIVPLQFSLGLTGKYLIGAMSTDAIKQAAKRADAGAPGIAAKPGFADAAGLVQGPTMSFTYLDTKAVFERVYGMFSSVAAMGVIPHLSDYVDISKLPAPPTISKHLTPIVASGAVKDGGILVESAGPVTTTQAAFATGLLAAGIAVPIIEQQMSGQSFSFPGFPGMTPGASGGLQNPLATPSMQGNSAIPAVPAPAPSQASPTPAASPSGGTP